MFHTLVKSIVEEIIKALEGLDEERMSTIVHSITQARRVVVHGAGRVGLVCKGFAMRLGHLGISANTPDDSTITSVGKDDLLIVGSSSGETQTVYDVAASAKKNGARVILITANADSRMAGLANELVVVHTPTKFGPTAERNSIQPMATLFEQSLEVMFDAIVLLLMHETHQTHKDLWARHTNLD